MRRFSTNYLKDGRGFNHGQPTEVIEVEAVDDFDTILDHIARTDFYGTSYMERQSGHTDDRLAAHFWWVAQAAASFRPRHALEIGCGRGDVLRILHDVYRTEVTGIDMGSGAAARVWSSVRTGFLHGEISDVLRESRPALYDLVCAFDIFEHLHPSALDETVDLVVRAGQPDAWFYFIVPAFGTDPVFGEVFPLELEENRVDFEHRTPFRHLIADSADVAVPAAGHLTWAHTDWWVELFSRHGLERVPEVERVIHAKVDPLVPPSIRAFYVLRKIGGAAPCAFDGRRQLSPLRSLLRRWWFVRTTGAEFNMSTLEEFERATKAGLVDQRVGRVGLLAAAVIGRAARKVQGR